MGFLVFGLGHATVISKVTDKQPTQTQLVNYAKSGSLVFNFTDGSNFSQLALNTKVNMQITGVVNRVKVVQSFTNPSSDWVEAVYVFPLPDESAVDGLIMHIGSRVIRGEIKEKQQAKKIYEAAKKSGKKTALIEQQRPNIFTSHIANIPPGETISIEITYQQAVSIENENFSIDFPMAIGDRYISGRKAPTPLDALEFMSNMELVKNTTENASSNITKPKPIQIDIILKSGFETESIASTYHPVNIVKINDLTKNIKLHNAQADRDFELVWRAKKGAKPSLAVFNQNFNGEQYLLLMVSPPKASALQKTNIPREVIFIVDSSGSMAGDSMEQASEALVRAIERLKPTDRFNVIDFDSEFTPLFETPMLATIDNKHIGVRFAYRLEADGGTDPLGAIKYGLSAKDFKSDRYLRQVVFLTDGQIDNEADILQALRQNIGNDRLFSIGIGSAPNQYFLRKMASFGGGSFILIRKIEEVKQKMTLLFNKLESPALTDIRIKFERGIVAQQAKHSILDLYAKESVSAVFKVSAEPNWVELHAKMLGKNFSKVLKLSNNNDTQGIAKLWARHKIDQLMDDYQATYDKFERKTIQLKVTELALDYHLVSAFTSLVAVEKTPSRKVKNQLKTHIVPKAKKFVSAAKTATSANLWMLFGILLILFAFVMRKKTV
jgi:Ca-activated chloride channel family protein